MPFSEVGLLDSRLCFVRLVLSDGWTVSAACREHGVSRTTGHKWLERYRQEQCAGLLDRSRRPLSSPSRTPEESVERVLEAKARYPSWGGRKISVVIGEGAPCARTVDRILKAEGLTAQAPEHRAAGRFEREGANELWQMDFKGVPRSEPPLLGCIDDASRFCLFLRRTRGETLADVWGALWEAFGEFGLPEAVLTDNGPAFRNNGNARISGFDLRLLLLGVRPLHGRPRHPQTQGKVERFFGTLEREKGTGRPDDFRRVYNEERPHEALGMDLPARRYSPSPKRRPEAMPSTMDFPDGSEVRRTDPQGTFSYKGRTYRVGRAISRTSIAVHQGEVFYGRTSLGALDRYTL